MQEIRVNDKFARSIKAFRGRDIGKKERARFIMKIATQHVYQWPINDETLKVIEDDNGVSWFVSCTPATERGMLDIFVQQNKEAHAREEMELAQFNLRKLRKDIAGILPGEFRSKIVLFMNRNAGDPVTAEAISARLMPGHKLENIGVKWESSGGSDAMWVVVISIPGLLNSNIKLNYVGYNRGSVQEFDKTGLVGGEFADKVKRVIL